MYLSCMVYLFNINVVVQLSAETTSDFWENEKEENDIKKNTIYQFIITGCKPVCRIVKMVRASGKILTFKYKTLILQLT